MCKGVMSFPVAEQNIPGPDPEIKSVKNLIIGSPLPTARLEGELLPKRVALPIFASDALSSVAYAPQELIIILLIGGLSFLNFAP